MVAVVYRVTQERNVLPKAENCPNYHDVSHLKPNFQSVADVPNAVQHHHVCEQEKPVREEERDNIGLVEQSEVILFLIIEFEKVAQAVSTFVDRNHEVDIFKL